MPRAKVKTPVAPTPSGSTSTATNDTKMDGDGNGDSSSEGEDPSLGKKRSAADMDVNVENGGGGDFGNEMQRMLECFGADISKTLSAKRKRLEQYTQGALKTSTRKVDEIWKTQTTERQKLHDEFRRQIMSVFDQWDSDVEKLKDQEEKLSNLYRQQQKFFQQSRVIQTQRLKSLKQLHEEYVKGIGQLEQCHTEQQTGVQGELKREMSMLQKKILMDTQQQEMASFRKSLHSMLY